MRCGYASLDAEWPGCDLWYCRIAKLYVWPGQECIAFPAVRRGDGSCFGRGPTIAARVLRCAGEKCGRFEREAGGGLCLCPGVDAEWHLNHGAAVSRINGVNRVWVTPGQRCIGTFVARQGWRQLSLPPL